MTPFSIESQHNCITAIIQEILERFRLETDAGAQIARNVHGQIASMDEATFVQPQRNRFQILYDDLNHVLDRINCSEHSATEEQLMNLIL